MASEAEAGCWCWFLRATGFGDVRDHRAGSWPSIRLIGQGQPLRTRGLLRRFAELV